MVFYLTTLNLTRFLTEETPEPKKKKKNHEASAMDDITLDVFDISFSTVVSEVHLVGSNLKEGGLTPMLHGRFALTKHCSLPSN